MTRPRARRWLSETILAAALALALPVAASADQAPGTQAPEPQRTPDFRFGAPKGSIGVRGSWGFATAGSDLFDFVTDQLTIDKDDFNAPGIGAEFNFGLTDRADIQAALQWQKASAPSEYRDLVDNEFLPIQQRTSLNTLELTGSVRFALTPRGHDVSRFAWVPRRVVPFVGAGGGVIYYDFTQTGDFVDFVDMSVFSDVFRSKGWAPSVHALGGVDVQVYRSLFATVEGRYTKAAATLDPDFIDFDPIDLSGFRISAGINLLF